LFHQGVLGHHKPAFDAGRFIGMHGVKAAHRIFYSFFSEGAVRLPL